MIDRIIKMYTTITSPVAFSDLVSIDVPEDGKILAIHCMLAFTAQPAPAIRNNSVTRCHSELSFLSSNQLTTNDARGCIAEINCSITELYSEATETGGAGGQSSQNTFFPFPDGIPVNAGERLHIHGSVNDGNAPAETSYLIYFDSKGGGRRAPSRR